MEAKKIKVPTSKPWKYDGVMQHSIDYGKRNEKIFLIELNEKGNPFDIQYNGTGCNQYDNRGFLVADFESKLKYFNPDYWHSLCRWHIDDHNELLFSSRISRKIKYPSKPYLITGEQVLTAILKEVSKKTGIKLEATGSQYQKSNGDGDWAEALINCIDADGKHYILTWSNCD